MASGATPMTNFHDAHLLGLMVSSDAVANVAAAPDTKRIGHEDPLATSPFNVLRQRAFRQFQSACRDLLIDARQRAKDPLDGLLSTMQRLLTGRTRPSVRFSHLADLIDDENVVVQCKAIAIEILESIHPISIASDDNSELAAFQRAIEVRPPSLKGFRHSHRRIGYQVHIGRLMSALEKLEMIVTDRALMPPVSCVPLSLSRIVTDCLLTFRPHLNAPNSSLILAVRYQPRDATNFFDQACWTVVCQTEVQRISPRLI